MVIGDQGSAGGLQGTFKPPMSRVFGGGEGRGRVVVWGRVEVYKEMMWEEK